jgi:hypothetical protein
MAEHKKTIKLLGNDTLVSDVPITSALQEHVNEYMLEDGSLIRVRSIPSAVLRVEGQFGPDGSPLYIVINTPVVSVLSSVIKSEAPEPAVN